MKQKLNENSATSCGSTAMTGSVAGDADMDRNIILDTSDEAATYRTGLSGWVSRGGFYFGDNKESEDIARYKGCTHRACNNCGEPTPKAYLACDKCRYKKELKKYNDMPEKSGTEKPRYTQRNLTNIFMMSNQPKNTD